MMVAAKKKWWWWMDGFLRTIKKNMGILLAQKWENTIPTNPVKNSIWWDVPHTLDGSEIRLTTWHVWNPVYDGIFTYIYHVNWLAGFLPSTVFHLPSCHCLFASTRKATNLKALLPFPKLLYKLATKAWL